VRDCERVNRVSINMIRRCSMKIIAITMILIIGICVISHAAQEKSKEHSRYGLAAFGLVFLSIIALIKKFIEWLKYGSGLFHTIISWLFFGILTLIGSLIVILHVVPQIPDTIVSQTADTKKTPIFFDIKMIVFLVAVFGVTLLVCWLIDIRKRKLLEEQKRLEKWYKERKKWEDLFK
jgi:hypothetical protein